MVPTSKVPRENPGGGSYGRRFREGSGLRMVRTYDILMSCFLLCIFQFASLFHLLKGKHKTQQNTTKAKEQTNRSEKKRENQNYKKRTPLTIGPCDAFSLYKPKPPIKWKPAKFIKCFHQCLTGQLHSGRANLQNCEPRMCEKA